MSSKVNHPDHYNQWWIECIDAIKAFLTEEEYAWFMKWNAFKYLWRERHKNWLEDLKKAQRYLTELIKIEVGKETDSKTIWELQAWARWVATK